MGAVVVPLVPRGDAAGVLPLSSSKIEAYHACPRQYWLKYVIKVKQRVEALTLVYGTLVHSAIEWGLLALLRGETVDFAGVFDQLWEERQAKGGFTYKDGGRSVTPAEVPLYGRNAMRAFRRWWDTGEHQVELDTRGEPLIEREITIDLGNGVRFTMKLDLILRHVPSQTTRVYDLKTPGNAKPSDIAAFHRFAPQLTAYEVGVRIAQQTLGIKRLGGSAFIDLQKMKNEARIDVPTDIEPRTNRQIQAWIDDVHGVATSIRNGQFAPTPRMAHSSPCSMCDFRALCWEADDDGLEFKSKADRDVALSTALCR